MANLVGKKVNVKFLDGRVLPGKVIAWIPWSGDYEVRYDGTYIPPTGHHCYSQLEEIEDEAEFPPVIKSDLYCSCKKPTLKTVGLLHCTYEYCCDCKKEYLPNNEDKLLKEFEKLLGDEF